MMYIMYDVCITYNYVLLNNYCLFTLEFVFGRFTGQNMFFWNIA